MTPRQIVVPLLAAGALIGSVAHAELTLPRVSPNAKVSQTIGVTDLSLTYSRPGVKNRAIWGGLVPYDQPWRTGANEATTFTCSDEITIGGQKLAAGTYSFFTIPTAKDWTVILSRQKDLWGAFAYDPKQDALRVTATPKPAEHTEWLSLGFENLTPTSGDLVLRWEKLMLAVPIQVEVNEKVLASCRREVGAAKADDWRTPLQAARWCFDNDLNLPEAKGWLDKSLSLQPGYSNTTLKARWLMKDGKKDEAIAAGKKAIELGKAAKPPANTTEMERLLGEWTAGK